MNLGKKKLELKLAQLNEIELLKRLSTEGLIIWVIGKSNEIKIKLSVEEIVLECWLINPEKHSLRGYPQFPDSFVITKRVFDMKGRKGFVEGTAQNGFFLSEIAKRKYADIVSLMNEGILPESKSKNAADRTISSLEEAPYKKLKRTPAYIKYSQGRYHEIVEIDFLYFYGINWHTKSTIVESKLKNITTVIKKFEGKDYILRDVSNLLNTKFEYIKIKLLNK